MALLSTYYDYELKREAFKLTGERGYARETDTLLKQVNVTKTTMDYCTVIYSVNVTGDKGSSNVVFYNNNAIQNFYKVTYNGSTYTISQEESSLLEWNINTNTEQYIAFRLNYNTENNITAKYLGNNKCVGSISKTNSLMVERPDNATTSITLTSTKQSYVHNESVSVTAVLNRTSSSLNPNAHKGRTIKFYDGDTLLGSATASSSSSTVTKTLNINSNGLHNITAVFEGSNYLYPSEATIQISKGYNIDVTYDKVWLNNVGSITATVSDYFDNLINECIVYCTMGTTQSAETNSSGVATFTNTNPQTQISTMTIETEYGDTSNSFTPTVAYLYDYNIVADPTIVSSNYATQLTISATARDMSGTEEVNLNGLKVTIPNASPSTVYLNNNGQATSFYYGESAGNVTLTANYGNNVATKNVTIEDVIQYWEANKNPYNINYSLTNAKLLFLNNGYKFERAGMALATLNLGSYDYPIKVEFDLLSISSKDLQFVMMSGGEYTILNRGSLESGDHVTITSNDGALSIIAEQGDSSFTASNQGAYGEFAIGLVSLAPQLPTSVEINNPSVSLPTAVSGGNMIINNLKIKRL